MKTALLALLTCVAGSAQTGYAPSRIFDYLGLTTTQIAAINRLNTDYSRYSMEKQRRMAQVQRELAAETARPQLDPMALGLRYVELETIRRELNDRLQKTRADISASLADAQKVKLKILEDAARLRPLISEAQCYKFLAVQPFPGNIIPASRLSPIGGGVGSATLSPTPVPACPPAFARMFPAQLGEFLSLTSGQADSVIRLNTDYNRYTAEKQARMAQVQRELAEETARPQLDPMALGLRYVELETIRRELNDQLRQTRADIAATLTDAQKPRIKTLEDAAGLQPLIAEAQCYNLIAAPSFATFVVGTPAVRTGDFLPMPTLVCGAGPVLVHDPFPGPQ